MTSIDLLLKKLLKETKNGDDVYKAEFGEYIPLNKATVGSTFRLAEVTDDDVIEALEIRNGLALKLIKRQKEEINILIRKKEALADEVADLQAEVKCLKEIIREMTEEET